MRLFPREPGLVSDLGSGFLKNLSVAQIDPTEKKFFEKQKPGQENELVLDVLDNGRTRPPSHFCTVGESHVTANVLLLELGRHRPLAPGSFAAAADGRAPTPSPRQRPAAVDPTCRERTRPTGEGAQWEEMTSSGIL